MNEPLPSDTRAALSLNTMLEKSWLNVALSFAAGALASLAMPPAPQWAVLFVSLPILYGAIFKAKNKRVAFFSGWLFGFGYFVFSLSWIANALLVEGNPYAWAWPLAACGLPALLAFFPAFACLLAKRFMQLDQIYGWFGFIAAFCTFEWLRGHIFTGFPWNLFGYTWVDILPMIQVLYLSDVYMLTLLTTVWACVPALFFVKNVSQKVIGGLVSIVSLFCVFVYGQSVLSANPPEGTALNLRVVQPNIAQHEKWDRRKLFSNFEKHLQLSLQEPMPKEPVLVIWPETAVSFHLLKTHPAQIALKDMLARLPVGSSLMTGYLRFDKESQQYFNSVVEFNRMGEIVNTYDKHHLVPFGEYIPFQEWIPLKPVAQFTGMGFGEGPRTLNSVQNAKISPLICYEIIFPGKLSNPEHKAGLIVNVTNDAWYGISAGPHQHLAKAIYRAVETGTPVARSANTGISTIVDPYGRQAAAKYLFTEDVINAKMPSVRATTITQHWFKHNFYIIIVLLFFSLGLFRKT